MTMQKPHQLFFSSGCVPLDNVLSNPFHLTLYGVVLLCQVVRSCASFRYIVGPVRNAAVSPRRTRCQRKVGPGQRPPAHLLLLSSSAPSSVAFRFLSRAALSSKSLAFRASVVSCNVVDMSRLQIGEMVDWWRSPQELFLFKSSRCKGRANNSFGVFNVLRAMIF